MHLSLLLSLLACASDLVEDPTDPSGRDLQSAPAGAAARITPAREEALVRHLALANIEATQDDIDRLDTLLAELEPRVDELIDITFRASNERVYMNERAQFNLQYTHLMRDLRSRVLTATFNGQRMVGVPVRRAVPEAWGGPLDVPLPGLRDIDYINGMVDLSTPGGGFAATTTVSGWAIHIDRTRALLPDALAAADAAEAALLASGPVPLSCPADRTMDHAIAIAEAAQARASIRREAILTLQRHLERLRVLSLRATEPCTEAERAALQADWDAEIVAMAAVPAATTFDGEPLLALQEETAVRLPDALLQIGLPILTERFILEATGVPVPPVGALKDEQGATMAWTEVVRARAAIDCALADLVGQQDALDLLVEDLYDRCGP